MTNNKSNNDIVIIIIHFCQNLFVNRNGKFLTQLYLIQTHTFIGASKKCQFYRDV